jgi:hypothetical protein
MVDGYQRPAAASDFERCVQLLGTNPRDDELLGALTAIISYHSVRSDMNAMAEVVETLRPSADEQRPWLRYIVESTSAWVALTRGDREAALRHMAAWEAMLAGDGEQYARTIAFVGIDGFVDLGTLRIFDSALIGDTVGGDAVRAAVDRRIEQMSPDQRLINDAQLKALKFWMLFERGDLHGAAALAREVHDFAKTHGIDTVRLTAATQLAAAEALLIAQGEPLDRAALVAKIKRLTKLLDLWRRIGLEVLRALYDAVVGRLLLAVDDADGARAWLDTSLEVSASLGQRAYDAEIMRMRAHTAAEPAQRHEELVQAREVARGHGFTLLELRAALDDFEFCGEPSRAALADVVGRMPPGSRAPELVRARELL